MNLNSKPGLKYDLAPDKAYSLVIEIEFPFIKELDNYILTCEFLSRTVQSCRIWNITDQFNLLIEFEQNSQLKPLWLRERIKPSENYDALEIIGPVCPCSSPSCVAEHCYAEIQAQYCQITNFSKYLKIKVIV